MHSPLPPTSTRDDGRGMMDRNVAVAVWDTSKQELLLLLLLLLV
ncbi:hypothetical protein BDDG_10040 [Blastomyces dermatitidis ATCC 18188]|uniref:Uncharacterized protein n=1 Tax=Ajellomyces dermatitidis (strain ATCC 18188 / CBS 674.68) TaxID=653446 RepID=F2TV25_AJEDA|nr:hypothetical protein BDDG_10040 [Blastomyces dermatitidis ATCC 18188]